MKYKIGQWVIVKSPIKGDKNKKTGKGRENRIGFIVEIDEGNKLYWIQMLTSKDKLNSNWIFKRTKGLTIKSRQYYFRPVLEKDIIRRKVDTKKFPDFSENELLEIKLLIHNKIN